MRLRLVINRNGLPPMKIWWDTSSFQPGDDKTVSSLLARVSQIVPLESSKWGLEDYAVEVDGFEILHFQEVETLIREADEVVIRPLSGTEIKQRRLSGRRQISTSGRKLIDGTPFGRSFLRPAPDRPSVKIPPRKRRKIGQTETDDTITVHAGSELNNNSYNQGESEEEKHEGEGYSDTSSEHRLAPVKKIGVGKYTPMLEIQGELEENKESEEESCSNFEYEGLQLDAKNDHRTILGIEINSHDSSEDEDFDPNSSQGEESDEEEDGEDGFVGEERPLATILGVIVDSSSESSDGDFDPRGVVSIVRNSDHDEETSSESDYTNPESSSSESESESESESDSESESESESEEVLFQPKKRAQMVPGKQATTHQRPPSSSSSSPPPSKTTESQGPLSPKIPKGLSVAPGTTPNQGKQSTKARNKRKSENRKLKKLIELGLLPGGTDHAGYLEFLTVKQTNELLKKPSEFMKQPTPEKKSESDKYLEETEKPGSEGASNSANRRKRYRKAFTKAKKNGTIPEGQDLDTWIEIRGQKRNAEKEKDGEGDIILTDANVERTSTAFNDAPAEESSKQKGVRGRPSVSLAAPKRTVLHDFGISKEKAKVGEELIRKEWAQTHCNDTANKWNSFAKEQSGKRPKKTLYDEDGNPVLVDTEDAPPEVSVEPGDPDSWKKKLVLSAVECEWEGVELPPPNFPFKQPTFQNLNEVAGNKRKRGGKGRRQQQEGYWGEDYAYGQDDGYYQQQQQSDWTYDYYDDTTQPTNTNDNQITDTTMEESEPVDDLPPLPEDINSLPPLTKPVLPHTVITFRQLTMDANYAPILADYRTAIIEEVDNEVGDGPFLVLKLAIRDRLKRHVDEMGEKVLRKFEMPGNNDDDEGRIELMFGELLEPKVVKLPEVLGTQNRRGDEGNTGQRTMDGAADGIGSREVMNDSLRKEHQDNASDQEYHSPTPKQRKDATKSTATIGRRVTPEEEAVRGKVASPLPMDEPPTEILQKQDPGPQINTPTASQLAHPNSPVYSQNFHKFKTPEPEAQRDVPMIDEVSYHTQITDGGEGGSTFQPVYDSDSDGLPTLESILASQPQKAWIKRESTQADNEPQFSSSGTKILDDATRSPEKSMDEQQIHMEVEGAKKVKPGRGRPKRPIESSKGQVIDLTATSDPPVVETPRRRRPRGRGAKGDKWRTVKS